MAGRRPAHAGQAAPCRGPRVRAACGGMRVHGPVLVGAAPGQALEAGASSPVGRLRRAGVGAGKRAGRFRPGPGRGRWRGAGRAFPGGVVPVFEHALGGGVAGRDRGMRVPGSAGGVREDGHGARGRGVRQRRRRGPPQRRRHGRPDPSVLPVPRALRVRAPVPRPVFRPREGRCGERGRLRGARPDGADAVGRGLPGVGPRVARRHPRRGRRMRVRGHRQSGGDRHRRRTDHRPGRNRHMRPTCPRGQGLLGRPGSETP